MSRPRVDFGIFIPQVGFTYDEIRERALACEALGFHSVWFIDHPGWGLEAGGYVGTPEDIVERIRENVARGVTLFLFTTHDRAAPETLRLVAETVLPAFT